MIEIDVLRLADLYAWLGCQKMAAWQFGCNQSTVSRRVREAAQWAAFPSGADVVDFLTLEREVYQHWRFARRRELRLHAYRWINPLLRSKLPETWNANPEAVSVTRACPLQLLRDHVIDALLAPWPVVADADRRVFELMPVYSAPLLLLAPTDSPLGHETGLSEQDIASASQLGDLDFVPPMAAACSRHLDHQLFESGGELLKLEEPTLQGAPSPQINRRYWGTPLTSLVCGDLVALDYRTPIQYTEFLVFRREWRDHPEIVRLFEGVRQSLVYLARDHPQLETLSVA